MKIGIVYWYYVELVVDKVFYIVNSNKEQDVNNTDLLFIIGFT